MAYDPVIGTEIPDGQPEEVVVEPAGTEGAEGQPDATIQTTGDTGPEAEDVIFDPAEFDRLVSGLTPELQTSANALRKSLQSNYTKKTTQIAGDRTQFENKIKAYDQFEADPVGTIQRYAQQFGLNVSNPNQEQQTKGLEDPQSWDDVTNHVGGIAEQRAYDRIMKDLSPYLGQFQNMRKSAIETELNQIDPAWQNYESVMQDNLKAHPTLANDPKLLYQMSVPSEVLESRATQAALKKLEAKGQSAKVAGSSKTTNQGVTQPTGMMTFAESVAYAKSELAKQGIRGA